MRKVAWAGLVVVLVIGAVAFRAHLVEFYNTVAQRDLLKVEIADLHLELAALSIGARPDPSGPESIVVLGGRTQMTSKNDVFASNNLLSWNLISPNAAATTKWSARMNPNTVYFRNQYWVVGTSHWNSPSNNITSPNDVWYSPDGINWKLTTARPPFDNYYAPFTSDFAGYYEYRATTLGNKMYVVGGKPGNGNKAVVWSSLDGTNWNVETAAAPFESRTLFSLVTHSGKMYVIGGRYGMNSYGNSGVWSSSDGATWTQVTATPAFGTSLANAKAISYNDRLYLLGGVTQTATSGAQSPKVWASYDGATWTLVSSTLPDPSHTGFDVRDAVVSDGKIWLGDAAYDGASNRLWSTTDGITWTQNTKTPEWSPRFSYRFLGKR